MTIGEVLRRSTDHLAARGAGRPRLEAERLLAHALGLERVELYMHLDRPLSIAELDGARALVRRRAAGEPLQYVLGEWGFRRLTLRVDARALIPRPETETLVERCLALLDGDEAPRVLELRRRQRPVEVHVELDTLHAERLREQPLGVDSGLLDSLADTGLGRRAPALAYCHARWVSAVWGTPPPSTPHADRCPTEVGHRESVVTSPPRGPAADPRPGASR